MRFARTPLRFDNTSEVPNRPEMSPLFISCRIEPSLALSISAAATPVLPRS